MKRQKYQDELKIGKIKEREDMAPRDIVLNNETGKKKPRAWKKKTNKCNKDRNYFHLKCFFRAHKHVPNIFMQVVEENTCPGKENEI